MKLIVEFDVHVSVVSETYSIWSSSVINFPFLSQYTFSIHDLIVLREGILNSGAMIFINFVNPRPSTIHNGK